MADVTMPLAELDKMRANYSEKEKLVKELEKTIADMEKDKRIVEITKIEYRPFQVKIKDYQIDKLIFDLKAAVDNDRHSMRFAMPPHFGYQSAANHVLNDFLSRNISSVSTPIDDTSKKSYINFDDVQAELRSIAEFNVADELGTLQTTLSKTQTELSKLKLDKAAELENLRIKLEEYYSEELQKVININKQLVKDYENLQNEKIEETLIDQLNKVVQDQEAEISSFNNLPWYKRIFFNFKRE